MRLTSSLGGDPVTFMIRSRPSARILACRLEVGDRELVIVVLEDGLSTGFEDAPCEDVSDQVENRVCRTHYRGTS